ncbi:MAG: MBL fold metallo-hydrolase [Sphaerochaetaceae bacterium]|jgi:phosphoribosyl 1,2-cyclic phosphodiesterase
MVNYSVLGSGSSGNSYLFATENSSILIDAGFSLKELKKRSKKASLDFDKIDALLLTHLHPDHAKGSGVFARQMDKPVYLNQKLIDQDIFELKMLKIPPSLIKGFEPLKSFEIGEFIITSFETSHDSPHSVGFNLSVRDFNITLVTDTGLVDQSMLYYFEKSDILFVEANYDDKMLKEGDYPPFLKKRISGKKGHLSNDQTIEALNSCNLEKLRHIYFCHLSKNNNSVEVVQQSSENLRWGGSTTICQHGVTYQGAIGVKGVVV